MGRKYFLPNNQQDLFQKINNRLFRKPLKKFPETVLIETHTGCNARCIFCPLEKLSSKMPKGRMSDKLLNKILDELSKYPPEKIFACFANEPFLDKQFVTRLQLIRSRVPKSQIIVTTNGSLLTPNICETILKTQCADIINISFQGLDKEAYEKTMKRLSYDNTLSAILSFVAMRKKMKLKKPIIKVSMVRTSVIDPSIDKAIKFWKKKGVKVSVAPLENRGGTVETKNLDPSMSPYMDCSRPFNTLAICFDGTVPLCCVDFSREVVVGDINKQTIAEIWNGQKLNDIRKNFLEPLKVSDFPEICKKCKRA